jgi:hypothetical protein
LAHLNVCGWTAENDNLRASIVRAIDADITSICESHLKDQNIIALDGYLWLGHNRTHLHRNAPKGSGGVGLLIKNWICEEYDVNVIDKSYDGILVVQFINKVTEYNFVIFSCYLPPENSNWGRDAQSFFSHILTQIYGNSDSDSIFILADFNARIGSLSDILDDTDNIPQRNVIDKSINQHGHDFLEFLNDAKFCVLNGRMNGSDNFTSVSRKGRSVVDYICIPHDIFHLCSSFEVITVQSIVDNHRLHGLLGQRSCLPDHSVLITDFTVSHTTKYCSSGSNDHEKCGSRYKLNRIPEDFMNSELSRLALLGLISQIERCRETQSEIDRIYETLCSTILSEMDAKIPKYETHKQSSKRHKHKKPYWNEELQSLWDTMRDKENKFLKCSGDRRTRNALRSDYTRSRDIFDKTLHKSERCFRASMATEIEEFTSSNPREFWNKIQKLGPRKDKSIPLQIIDDSGLIQSDEAKVFERWKRDFENLYNARDGNDFNDEFHDQAKIHKHLLELQQEDPLYIPNEQLNSNILLSEINNIIMRSKTKSSSGIDGIPYNVLKFPEVVTALHQLFQLVFDTSIIPSQWRKAVICPILKDSNSDARVPMNYRGISLLSCISKIYSSFINRRLTKYLNDNSILAEEQNGFRADRSCEDHIYTLSSVIRNNESVFSSFIDLRQCFDFIDRDMMLYKLLLNKIDGKVYRSIKSIYKHSVSCIRINNKLTDWFDCKTGVKQGDNLSPTLFSIFINDLVKEINDLDLGIPLNHSRISILLYADDIVLLAKNEQDLQTMLNKLKEWCKQWRVLVNTNKSKCIHFRKGRTQRSDFVFTIGENILQTVETYKYLGVIFHEKGSFTHNSDALSKGAGRALGSLISKVYKLKNFGFKTYTKLYESCVIPILDYSASVWGFKHYQTIDNVQNRAMRFFLGVHRFTPTLALIGDTGWLPSMYRRWLIMIRYWNRLLSLDNSRLTKQAFELDYSICDKNWCSEIKSILLKLNFNTQYENKTIVNYIEAKEKIISYYSSIWYQDVQMVPKLRTYRTFKTNFKCEEYMSLNLKRNERSLLAQFRCGILPLRIETGRYVGEEPVNRTCNLCNSQSIEDETHFLVECTAYHDIRNYIFQNIIYLQNFTILDSKEKLVYLLNMQARKVSKYIVSAYLRRRRIIYN